MQPSGSFILRGGIHFSSTSNAWAGQALEKIALFFQVTGPSINAKRIYLTDSYGCQVC